MRIAGADGHRRSRACRFALPHRDHASGACCSRSAAPGVPRRAPAPMRRPHRRDSPEPPSPRRGGEVPDVEPVANVRPPRYGPPDETPGIPSDVALERDHAVIGQVLIDNQNIFNLEDPKDDTKLFRLADRLHVKTRASVVRPQLLFKPGRALLGAPAGGVRAPAARELLLLRRLDPPGTLPGRQGGSEGHHARRVDPEPRVQLRPQRRHQLHRREARGSEPARHRHVAEILLLEQRRPLGHLGRRVGQSLSWAAGSPSRSATPT